MAQVQEPMQPFLIDARTAAKSLSISERKLWSLTQTGGLPCVRIGKRVLYDPGDIRRWIDRQKIGSSINPENSLKESA